MGECLAAVLLCWVALPAAGAAYSEAAVCHTRAAGEERVSVMQSSVHVAPALFLLLMPPAALSSPCQATAWVLTLTIHACAQLYCCLHSYPILFHLSQTVASLHDVCLCCAVLRHAPALCHALMLSQVTEEHPAAAEPERAAGTLCDR